MKGSELELRYFDELGKPLLQNYFLELFERIAITGLMGSQARGHDDTISRDHAWGPSFMIWMLDTDYEKFGATVDKVLNTELPTEFLGYQRQDLDRAGGKKVFVVPLKASLKQMLGYDEPPAKLIDWLKIPQNKLSDIMSLQPFHDPSNLYGSVKEKFSYYPEEIRYHLLSVELSAVAEWGSYQFLRAAKRRDILSQVIYWARYVEAMMRFSFVMCRRYAPFHKWLDREFHQLPDPVPEIAKHLDTATLQVGSQVTVIAEVQELLIQWILDQRLTTLAPDYRVFTWWDETLAHYAGCRAESKRGHKSQRQRHRLGIRMA